MPRRPGMVESGDGQDARMPRRPGMVESGDGQDARMPRRPGMVESGRQFSLESMDQHLRIAMGQLNMLVGDVVGNTEKLINAARKAHRNLNADLIAFPELALTGYPPEDLLFRNDLLSQVEAQLAVLAKQTREIDVIVGHPQRRSGKLYNAASLLRGGRVHATYFKQHLPNYGVFDEKRYFVAGVESCIVDVRGAPVGITICEDVWEPGPVEKTAQAGAKVVININSSPFHLNKGNERVEIVAKRARPAKVPIIYINLVGGQDELVFDGESFVMDAAGAVTQRAPAFEEGLFAVDIDTSATPMVPVPETLAPPLNEVESAYRAIVLGVRDYINKNGFNGAVLGLSGGIDSGLTLAIAVDAIGPKRVEAVMMPSRYTADMSLEDAHAEAEALGVDCQVIPIEPMFDSFTQSLAEQFRGLPPDTTEENIQARIRGVLLMAISNKSGKMVLTTGNKSEMAVGYATLYGDMVGGFAAIKDVPKTMVYQLAHYRNHIAPVIPERMIERPPSAELAADQKDTDTLPSYELLDAVLERYVEQDQGYQDIVDAGFDAKTVLKVLTMVDRNEYKRRQAPPGVRITPRAFGRDRRYPITSGFRRRDPR
jgi:NAD+ synthase (glutamine-hydrolysing)